MLTLGTRTEFPQMLHLHAFIRHELVTITTMTEMYGRVRRHGAWGSILPDILGEMHIFVQNMATTGAACQTYFVQYFGSSQLPIRM